MLATISKTWRFEAAHRLPNHAGKCAQPHGHSYEATVAVVGRIKPPRGESDDGMVCDFSDLSTVWKRTVEPLLDHRDLNESIGAYHFEDLAPGWPTTAENIARWIGVQFRAAGIPAAWVELRETATSLVRVDLTPRLPE